MQPGRFAPRKLKTRLSERREFAMQRGRQSSSRARDDEPEIQQAALGRGVTLNLARGAARAIGMSRTQWVCMSWWTCAEFCWTGADLIAGTFNVGY
jgi:hypothetical protein